eukprot:361603-Chlamydomonas_euryale.AAC.8
MQQVAAAAAALGASGTTTCSHACHAGLHTARPKTKPAAVAVPAKLLVLARHAAVCTRGLRAAQRPPALPRQVARCVALGADGILVRGSPRGRQRCATGTCVRACMYAGRGGVPSRMHVRARVRTGCPIHAAGPACSSTCHCTHLSPPSWHTLVGGVVCAKRVMACAAVTSAATQ